MGRLAGQPLQGVQHDDDRIRDDRSHTLQNHESTVRKDIIRAPADRVVRQEPSLEATRGGAAEARVPVPSNVTAIIFGPAR